jgi:hypothetical protein
MTDCFWWTATQECIVDHQAYGSQAGAVIGADGNDLFRTALTCVSSSEADCAGHAGCQWGTFYSKCLPINENYPVQFAPFDLGYMAYHKCTCLTTKEACLEAKVVPDGDGDGDDDHNNDDDDGDQ